MLKSEKVGVLAAVRRHRIERLTFDSVKVRGKSYSCSLQTLHGANESKTKKAFQPLNHSKLILS